MKIYIVTSGEYSDYHIDAVFTDYAMASKYANISSDREIEEYEADSIQINEPELIYNIYYDYEMDRINSLYPGRMRNTTLSNYRHTMDFSIMMNDKLFESIQEYGCKSKLLLKIAQDKFTYELYKLGISREELIKKVNDNADALHNRYTIYTSSIDTMNPFERVATKEVENKINAMYDNGEPLPDAFTLMRWIRESKNKQEGGDNI